MNKEQLIHLYLFYLVEETNIDRSVGVHISPFFVSMFIGEYQHSVDDKNRLAIPVKFRRALKGGAVVTRGIDNCLFLFSKLEWQKLAEKIAQLPISQSQARAFARLMLAGAMHVSLDSQGRVILPDYLKKYARLQKKVVVAGVFNRIEIWNESVWRGYKTMTEKASEKIAEQMGELGI